MIRLTRPAPALPLRLALALVVLGALALAPTARAVANEDGPGLMSVTGEASVPAIPDMATLRLAVVTEARTGAQALAENTVRMQAVLDELRGFDIAERDLQTSELTLSPVYENTPELRNLPRRLIAFRAQNGLTVRVRDLDRLGEILDVSVRDGANSFGGLSFGVQAPGPVEAEARDRAMKDALARARTLAEAAGVGLGPIRSITEHGGSGGPRMMRAEMAMADSAVPVAVGEVTVSASVSLVIELVQ
jgi:uncharacterized protein YggE